MSTPCPVILMGFPDFEYSSLATLFRLAGHHDGGYVVVGDPDQAKVIIANAEDGDTMAALRGRHGLKVLLVGRKDHGTGWPLQPRPIKLMSILHALDALTGKPPSVLHKPRAEGRPPEFEATQPYFAPQRGRATPPAQDPRVTSFEQTQPYMAPVSAAEREARQERVKQLARGFEATQPFSLDDLMMPSAGAAPAPAREAHAEPRIDADAIAAWRHAQGRPEAAPVPTPAPVQVPAASAVPAPAGVHQPFEVSSNLLGIGTRPLAAPVAARAEVLVADDNDVSRRNLQKLLHSEGLRADMVRTGQEAVAQVLARPYSMVLVDESSTGDSAYQTVRALRQRKPAKGRRAMVVLMSNRGGTFDKLRAKLAGCDAYLVKPVTEEALLRTLQKFID